ncbi:hypothetical protein E4198_19395 [Streptomyces sp. RKND-216]|uniref:ATP-binding protein n=1 Tax=Streptomyces hazeniae TaxID=3075538 RepID=A0ABU2NK93_9ACTN|nr:MULTISPECIES: hypothetical protein [unclassified Streptomyces]MDT0377416.1 hypothetical protein [Streptomyces sp. DSM 42041]THA26550.1 hypothetical protein E4198_19395 [Streptomyces sp. RKND-216]
MTKPTAPRRHLPTSPFAPAVVAAVEEYAAGDRVSHDRYGLGRVLSVGHDDALIVDFGSHQARIVTPYKGMDKL